MFSATKNHYTGAGQERGCGDGAAACNENRLK
jgi:hypothetical protein